MIHLSEKHLDAIRSHGESTYPNECGGMLIGRFVEAGEKELVETFPLENASEENQRNRVLLLPTDVMRAEKYARENKLDVIGYYHSHPDDRAIPSEYDLDHALPVWSYIIVSVRERKAVDVRSWEMENDRSKFNEETIEKANTASE
ncbi:MAG: M67 family metallopeptidase [Acidobacteriota bacterium]